MLRKLLFLLIFLFSAALLGWSGPNAAQAYRWVDERGVTHYSERPPENRPSKTVNTRPAAASVDAEGKLIDPPKPAAKSAPQPAVAVAPPPASAPAVAPVPPPARGMDFGVYIQLQRGMSEGEVLLRAGPPDHESYEGGRHFVVKSLYYYPTVADPFITVITLRGGRVAAIERTRKNF